MKKVIFKILLGLIALTIWSCDTDNGLTEREASTDKIKYGSGDFVFDAYEPFQDRPIRVFYYNPGNAADLPIMIYMHGNGRNAEGYRNGIAQYAHDHNFLVIVPEFTAEDYPSREYHRGGVLDVDGEPVDEANWTFSMIEPLFDYVKEEVGSKEEDYVLYGFSAGGQFVHRFIWHKPDNRARLMIAGSAGYYTMPDWNVDYAYGLNNTAVDEAMVKQALQNKVYVIVGGDDQVRDDEVVQTAAADAEGWNRVERARNFYLESQALAANYNIPFNWGFGIAPGQAHSHQGVAALASEIAFGTPPEPVALETVQIRLDRPGYNADANLLDVMNMKRHSRNDALEGAEAVQPKIDLGLWNSSRTNFTMILPSDSDRLTGFGSGSTIIDEWTTRNDGVLMKLPADSGNQELFESLETQEDILAAFEAAESKLEELGLDEPDDRGERDYGPGKYIQRIAKGELIFFHSTDRNVYMVGIVDDMDNQSTGYADLSVKRIVVAD
ncbi:alpha/beta fold hydrolase [Sinomicrobium sp.]